MGNNRKIILELTYKEYLNNSVWKDRSKAAKDRANNRCQLCNSNGILHTHHRTYERIGKELPGDLIVLCEDCHAKFHDKDQEAVDGNGIDHYKTIKEALELFIGDLRNKTSISEAFDWNGEYCQLFDMLELREKECGYNHGCLDIYFATVEDIDYMLEALENPKHYERLCYFLTEFTGYEGQPIEFHIYQDFGSGHEHS